MASVAIDRLVCFRAIRPATSRVEVRRLIAPEILSEGLSNLVWRLGGAPSPLRAIQGD